MHPALQRWLVEAGLTEAQTQSLRAVLRQVLRDAVLRLVGQTAAAGFAPAVLDLIEGEAPNPAPVEPAAGDATRLQWLCRIGEGGTSEVWRVYDPRLDRTLALKVLRPELQDSAAARARFTAEVFATAALSHPGVVPVHEAGILPDGRPYFLMREVVGQTLAQVMEASARDTAAVVDVLRRVAETLAHAHARGVTHRDLKPDNVMVGPFGEVLVLDWGLARDTLGGASPEGARLTRVGDVLGTPAFMAPEQARGEATGPWTDVWALGALLYTALTGRAPYGEAPVEALLARARAGRVARVEVGARSGLRPLAAVAARAMAASPAARYPSAAAFVAELEAWQGNRPVSAHRYRLLERGGLWLDRHRGARITGAVGLAALSLLALLALLGIRSQRDEALARLAESRVLAARYADGEDNYGEAGNLAGAAGLATLALDALDRAGVAVGGPDDPRPDLRGVLVRAAAARLPTRLASVPALRCLQLAWSPDGRRLACAAAGEGLVLWDGGERRLASARDVRSVSWIDEGRLWLGTSDGAVYRWEIGPDQESDRLALVGGMANALAALPDGGVVIGGEVPQLYKYNPKSTPILSDPYLSIAFALSPDGRWLVTGAERLATLWDLEQAWQRRQELTLPEGAGIPVAARWSPDGSRVAWVGTDGQVHLFDRDGQWIRTFGRCPGTLYGLGWQDERTLYTGGGDGTVRAWDVEIGRENLRLPVSGTSVESLAVAPGRLAVGRADGLEIWSLPPARPPLPPGAASQLLHAEAGDGAAWIERYVRARHQASDALELSAYPLSSEASPPLKPGDRFYAFTGAGRMLLGVLSDEGAEGAGRFGVVDLVTGATHPLDRAPWYPLRGRALSRDGQRAALVDPGGTLHLFDVASGHEIGAWDLPSEPTLARILPGNNDIHLLEDGRVIAECWPAGQVRFRDAVSGAVRSSLVGPSDAAVEQWAFSPDEQSIAWALVDGRVYLQDRASAQIRPLRAEGTNFAPFAFVDGGRLVASGGTDGRTYVWEVASGALLARFRAHDTRTWLLSGDGGSQLVTLGFGRAPRRWDLSAEVLDL